MKPSLTKLAKTTQTPALQTVLRKPDAPLKVAATDPKPQKREHTFSKSRDTREDRSTRQMKSARNSQTFPHVR